MNRIGSAVAAVAAVFGAACAHGEKLATQKWVERLVASAVQTNGLDEASVNAIIEARENNGELFVEEDGSGVYYYMLTRLEGGRYTNRCVRLKSSARNELGTYQGARVYRSTLAGLREGEVFGFAVRDGAAVLKNASNEFAYAERQHGRTGVNGTWIEGVVTNAAAWGSCDLDRALDGITLKAADGGTAVITPYLMFAENWMAAAGEATTNAYGGVDAAVHWATNAIRVDARTVMGFSPR